MGQTAAETRREIAQTRAQLTDTLATLEARAAHALDWRTQLRTNRAVRATAVGLLAGAVVLLGFFGPGRPLRRFFPQPSRRRWTRRLRQAGIPADRFGRLTEEGRAWLEAQRRLIRSEMRREPATRRLLLRSAEAGASALAAGLAKMLVDRARARAVRPAAP